MTDSFLSFENSFFLITGAGSGIGKATSLLLRKFGARLLLIDINEDALKQTISECGTNCIPLVTDLIKEEDLKSKISQIIRDNGKLNGMVHCAGMPYISPLKAINKEKVIQTFSLNAVSGLELCKIFAMKNHFDEKDASVVFISSVYAHVGSSANVGYALSKGGITSMTKSLAIELASKRIRVNCVAPGFIKTNMSEDIKDSFDNDYNKTIENMHPLGWGKAEDVANSIIFLLSGRARWITGTTLHVDGGFTAQ